MFIGMLIGGAVPFLFSAMTIRAVGRAAYLIVFECRRQFRDPEIMAGTKTPDYGRVVDICTGTAQKELIGPGLLAIGTPLVVGFLLGPFALGGFLAGMILERPAHGGVHVQRRRGVGQRQEDDRGRAEGRRRPARAREKHKASVTGDTVGDPLKDTSGPAINPLIKVMNMVSLLALPLVILHNVKRRHAANSMVGVLSWSWSASGGGLGVVAVEAASTTEVQQMDEQCRAGRRSPRQQRRELVREPATTVSGAQLRKPLAGPGRGPGSSTAADASPLRIRLRYPVPHVTTSPRFLCSHTAPDDRRACTCSAAMPVMLGVLCVLAIAYRYYSAFLAAKVAALDDSRVDAGPPLQRRPELPPDEQVGAVRPPLRRHLRRRAADRPGAGDPVRLHAGPAVAGDRRLPGRGGAGHARAGRVASAAAASRWPRSPAPSWAGRPAIVVVGRDPVHRHHRPGRAWASSSSRRSAARR